MKPQINMIGIITSNFSKMRDFYRDVLGFSVILELEQYVEFENKGVRLAISTNDVMAEATGDASFKDPKSGHSFELAFCEDKLEDVDKAYADLEAKGARMIKQPATMPWRQRTAFFADPDGNVHEVFADLPEAKA